MMSESWDSTVFAAPFELLHVRNDESLLVL